MDALRNNESFKRFTGKSEMDKAISTLLGLVKGITIDDIVNEDEMSELANWVSINSSLEKITPFNEIIPMIKESLADGTIDKEEIQDLIWVCQNFENDGIFYDWVTLAIQELHGIMHGILADNQISDDEIFGLQDWLNYHNYLENTYPYEELRALLTRILKDGVITESEKEQLKAFMGEFIDFTTSYNLVKSELEAIKKKYSTHSMYAKNPNIEIPNHLFCFTGKSCRATRNEIQEIIVSREGLFKDTVVKKTEYLIIGDDGNPCWAFSCYGRKVEKALELKKEGIKILLVHEDDFWGSV